MKLACVNSIGENAYDSEYVASGLIKILKKLYDKDLRKYYGFSDTDEITVETIAHKKSWILKGGKPDLKRTSQIILSTFQNGKIGNFTLDRVEEFNELI